MNRAALRARRHKLNKWHQYRLSGSYNDRVEYNLARRKADREYRRARGAFESRVAAEVGSNPKSFYAYVRSKTTVRDIVGPLKSSDGTLVSGSEEMCKVLNDFLRRCLQMREWRGSCRR
jgi:hypothetical protein